MSEGRATKGGGEEIEKKEARLFSLSLGSAGRGVPSKAVFFHNR